MKSNFQFRGRKPNRTRDWNRAHLSVVDQNFSKTKSASRTKQRLPLETEGSRPILTLLEGGGQNLWRPLTASERTLSVKVSFLEVMALYVVEISREGELIECRYGKRTNSSDLVMGFSRVNGEKIRIPWARIARGESWSADVEMYDFFFQRLEEEALRSHLMASNAERMKLESH